MSLDLFDSPDLDSELRAQYQSDKPDSNAKKSENRDDTGNKQHLEDEDQDAAEEDELEDDVDDEEEAEQLTVLSDRTNLPTPEDSEEMLSTSEKLFRFPLGTIKKIVKLDPDLHMASQDAIFLISKATEFFVESIAEESYGYTSRGKKKTIQKVDVDSAIESCDALAFLDGALED